MSPKPYPFGNANLSTCEWFVPELARWASRLKLDDDNAPTSLPTGPQVQQKAHLYPAAAGDGAGVARL